MIGTVVQDRYRIDAELGRGGMGVVYRAHDLSLDRGVAIKVLLETGLNEQGKARLWREAQSVARLNHPNIVDIYDVGQANGAPFLVMELVSGAKVDGMMLTLPQLIAVGSQICAALEHAHAHGIVHRDLKPENIVVLTGEGESAALTVKLMDFGLARSTASRLTAEAGITGTVFYIAPEQALGQDVDGRADLYSLGIILYELATGRLPFTADDPLAIISQHIHASPIPPRTIRPEIPPSLEAIIFRLLAKSPADRFASAREVAVALANIQDAEVSTASAGLDTTDSVALLEQLARGRMVGRQSELNQLSELWLRAQQGRSQLVLISGEPGVGKTRLAHELMVYAQLNGAFVMHGGCYEYEATTPYLPFVEALREWVRRQSTDELREHLGAMAPEIAKLAPEVETKLGGVTPNPTLPPNEERLRLFDSVARFLQTVAGEHGLLFFIDDLHWADQGTLSLLHYLLRHLRQDRVLILAAYRELELDRAHPLAAALVEWNRERLATRLQLARLSLDQSGALLATLFGEKSVSSEFAQAIHRETEGNPFFIEEVVKALIEQGQIYRVNGQWERKEVEELAIPQSIKEAIGRRLNRLSEACTDVLHTAAALGKTFAFPELAASTPLSEDALLDALDEAELAQLTRVESSDTFVFTHDKIREVLYEELNPIRRRRLHQRIGEVLEKLYAHELARGSDAHIQELAHHFTEAGDLARGLQYSFLAARKTERLFAHDDALHYYEHARECAQALDQPDQLAAIDEGIADVYVERGEHPIAIEQYERALILTSDGEKRAALKSKIGSAYGQIGDARGLEFLQEALNELNPKTQQIQLAMTTALIGRYHHYRLEHSRAIEFLERAREIAEPLDDGPTLTLIYGYLAGAFQHLARFEQSMEWARRSIAYGESKNYPPAIATGYEFLAEDSFAMGYWKDAIAFAERDRQVGEKTGALDRIAWAEWSRSGGLAGLGQLSSALEIVRDALALAERIGEKRLMIWLRGGIAHLETDLGIDDAAQDAALAVQHADSLGQVALQCLSRNALGYFHIQNAEWDQAAVLYERCAELLHGTEHRIARLMMGANAAQAFLGKGDRARAERMIEDYIPLAQEARAPHYAAVGQRVQGQILTANSKWDAAEQAFDRAIATLGELSSRVELGRAFFQRGQMWQMCGRTDLARRDVARAHELFDECGAVRDRERTKASLQLFVP